jgi:hypothetical protein
VLDLTGDRLDDEDLDRLQEWVTAQAKKRKGK